MEEEEQDRAKIEQLKVSNWPSIFSTDLIISHCIASNWDEQPGDIGQLGSDRKHKAEHFRGCKGEIACRIKRCQSTPDRK